MRQRLFILTLAALAPLIVLAAGLAYYSIHQQQAALSTEAVRHVGNILDVVERSLHSEVRSLQVLANSPSLDNPNPDLAAFQIQALRFREEMEHWNVVILADLSGRQIVNTRLPLGAALPEVVDNGSYRRVIDTRQPVIGNVSGPGPLANDSIPRVSIRVPVLRDGQLRYVLTAIISPIHLSEVVGRGIDPQWRAFLIDGAGLIAASAERPEAIGRRPSEQTLMARASSREGIYEGLTLDGVSTVTAFRKSDWIGWSAHVSIPRAIYNAPLIRSIQYLAAAVLAALALSFVFVEFLRREASRRQRQVVAIEAARKNAEQIGQSLQLRDRSLGAIAQGVVITDALLPDNPIIYINPAFEQLTGYAPEEVIGRNCRFLQGPDTDPAAVALIRDAIKAGQNVQTTLVNHRKDGTTFVNELTISPVRDGDGNITHFVGTQADVTAQQLLQERLHLALSAGRMVAWERDLATGIVERSKNAIALLGIGSGPNADFFAQVHAEDRSLVEQFIETVGTTGSGSVEFRYSTPGEKILWLSARAKKCGPNRIIGVMFDVTDRKKAEEEAWRAANHDPLTGLPNRLLFHHCLEQALATAQQNGTSVSLLLIDMDDFRDINDTLGHDVGDAFLKETAARLSLMIRDCDTLARLGGDEFAFIVVEPLVLENAARLAEFTIENLREPFTYAGRTFVSRASVGVAAFPDHDTDPAELVKAADIALHRAKQQGGNRVVTYSSAMRAEIEEKVSLAAEVRNALSQGQIIPFYQPKVCLSTGRIMGFEALARWQHPTKGILTPQYFGTTFADQDIAAAIGERLIARVAMDMRLWLDRGLDIGRVAVNLSSAEFDQPGLAADILETLARHNIPTEYFEVEVTETVLLGRSADDVASTLERLKQNGIQIALDDFGTGYASLTHLKQFPVDHVKIDQSFVRDMHSDREDEVIIAAVIGLGENLGLQITAEGVETEAQAQRLRELGCHNAQGYFYAKPMAASQSPSRKS